MVFQKGGTLFGQYLPKKSMKIKKSCHRRGHTSSLHPGYAQNTEAKYGTSLLDLSHPSQMTDLLIKNQKIFCLKSIFLDSDLNRRGKFTWLGAIVVPDDRNSTSPPQLQMGLFKYTRQ